MIAPRMQVRDLAQHLKRGARLRGVLMSPWALLLVGGAAVQGLRLLRRWLGVGGG